jgi:hypothetical protein
MKSNNQIIARVFRIMSRNLCRHNRFNADAGLKSIILIETAAFSVINLKIVFEMQSSSESSTASALAGYVRSKIAEAHQTLIRIKNTLNKLRPSSLKLFILRLPK